jgi:hypothetical protein
MSLDPYIDWQQREGWKMREERKVKVSELTGAELDYWVAKADGFHHRDDVTRYATIEWSDTRQYPAYSPSTNWNEGGPIIEKEKIDLMHVDYRGEVMGGKEGEPWNAMMQSLSIENPDWDSMSGPTALIAAMRAYVGSKFGANVPSSDSSSHVKGRE